MKKMPLVLAMSLLTSVAALAGELSAADKKWAAVVEKMIQEGAEKVSTPNSNRANLAVELAKKQNRTGTIQKTDKGYDVVFSSTAKSATIAKNGN